jgi:hypothetical protein
MVNLKAAAQIFYKLRRYLPLLSRSFVKQKYDEHDFRLLTRLIPFVEGRVLTIDQCSRREHHFLHDVFAVSQGFDPSSPIQIRDKNNKPNWRSGGEERIYSLRKA